MLNNNFFLVIEGLDGSGKTEISRRLAQILQIELKNKVMLTFEPHDPSCAGLFIRQILMKKITSPSTRNSPNSILVAAFDKILALAFAANRLDHCNRQIRPFLKNKERIVVCDRYYLSSLVYQATPNISMEEVMELNKEAEKPDLIIFLNASNRNCYERMKRRAQDKELFEKNLKETRKKYKKAIEFLREKRQEHIVEINADGNIDNVLNNIIAIINDELPSSHQFTSILSTDFLPKVFSLEENHKLTIAKVALDFSHYWNQGALMDKEQFYKTLLTLEQEICSAINNMSFNDLGSLFLDYVNQHGYIINERLAWSDIDAFKAEYNLPLNITQKGTILFIGEGQRHDTILRKSLEVSQMSDFMLVFVPSDPKSTSKYNYYERDVIQYSDGTESLSPTTKLISKEDITKNVLEAAITFFFEEHYQTLSALPRMKTVLLNFCKTKGIRLNPNYQEVKQCT